MAQIGIDFGTTNSLVVAYDKKKHKFTYFSFNNEDTTQPAPISSTVWYYDNSVTVGSVARENINTYAGVEGHHFEKSIKLKLDQEYGVNIFGRTIQPHSIASDILKHIKRVAIDQYKADKSGVDMNRAIFTVPINFSGIQRKALRKAAQEAGIEVTTFIHEPFAAIVGYFFTNEKGFL
jgi:molecular chaperone DnaK (HSP70)